MPRKVDNITKDWITDMSKLLDTSFINCQRFWELLKNYECHVALEQYLEDKEREFYDFAVPPLGSITLKRSGKEWQVHELHLSTNFINSLNESLRVRESNLHREIYTQNLNRVTNFIDRYSESQQI